MYFEKAREGNNKFWTYLVTLLLVIFFSQMIGAAPLGILLAFFSSGSVPITSENILDPAALGIDPNLYLALMVLPFATGLAGLWIGIKFIHNKKFKSVLTGLEQFNVQKVLYGAGIWAVLFLIYLLLSIIIDGTNYEFQFQPLQFLILLVVSFAFIPIQSTFEEVFFRGYLMQGFALLFKNKWIPLLVTSIAFGLLHLMNPEVDKFGAGIMLPQYIFYGIFFSIVVIMDEGLELAIGIHAINNIFAALFVTHDSSVLQTPALFTASEIHPLVDFMVLIVMSVVFLLICSRRLHWKKWSYIFERIKANQQ